MLEALLNHYRSKGMDDLDFIIVNSKLSHAQEKLHELEKRVSFSVYQETDEEEVWSVMEGGKDDMYVYDRCGRLTYYVPFPLSILNESPLVSNAILATYFRSPCGESCDKNETLEIEEIAKNLQDDVEMSTNVTEESALYNMTEVYVTENDTGNYTSNDLFGIINEEYDLSIQNSTEHKEQVNNTDTEYAINSNSTDIHEGNNSTIGKATEYFNTLYRLFFNLGDHNDLHENSSTINMSNTTTNETVKTSNKEDIKGNLTEHTHHSRHKHHHKISNKTEEAKERKKSNRCAEADYIVCKTWSKKRLLNAQRCCSELHNNGEVPNSCQNFGKRRCKKIQSILKCCIKTVYTEATEVPSTTEEMSTVTESSDVVCCSKEGEKKCRVSNLGACNEDEYIQERSPVKSK